MTTIIPFVPSKITPPSFRITLDANEYQVIITWNVSAQRYYINLYDVGGNWIITTPIITTPPARKASSAVYDRFQKAVIVQLVPTSQWPVPLNDGGFVIKPGTIVDYTLENFQPDVYNGFHRSIQISPTMFSYSQPTAIDVPPLVLGYVSRILNMVGGMFDSTFIYRNGSFEVSP